MRKLSALACVLAVLGTTSVASAKKRVRVNVPRPQLLSMSQVRITTVPVSLQSRTYPTLAQGTYAAPPAPAAEVAPPAPGGGPAVKAGPAPIRLFHCVKYRDLHHIAPCAVTKIVKIVDPCWKPDPCSCCRQCAPCVYVMVCVPPCGCADVRVSRNGHVVRYDYGKYAVDIVSRNGKIYIDYDD